MYKKILIMIVIALLCSGCKATPESVPILDRSNDYIPTDAIMSDELTKDEPTGEEQIAPIYEYPSCYIKNSEIAARGLSINFNAQIVFPDLSLFPILRVSKRRFDSENYSKLVEHFCKNAELYYVPERTQEEWMELLVEAKRGDNIDGTFVQTEASAERVKEIEKIIPTAPIEKKSIPFDFSLSNYLDDEQFQCIDQQTSAYFKGAKNGNEFMFSRSPDFILQDAEMVFMGDAISGEQAGAQIETVLDQDSAIAVAQDTLKQLDLNSYVLDDSKKARMVSIINKKIVSTGWLLYYVPEYNGLRLYNMEKSFVTSTKHLPSIAAPWAQESIEIYVDTMGVSVFNWAGATEMLETERSNLELLPFDKLAELIDRQIGYTFAKVKIQVNEIKLGCSLLSIPNETNVGRIIPTWYAKFDIVNQRNLKQTQSMAFTAHDGGYVEPRLTVYDLMEYNNRF